jgi:hypothetical protein
MPEITLERLKALYPDSAYQENINLNLSRGLSPEQIFQNYLKEARPHIYQDKADGILSAYGDEFKTNLYENIKEGKEPDGYIKFLDEQGYKPNASVRSAESLILEEKKKLPLAASPTAKVPTTGALPTPEPATGGPLTTTPQPKIQPARVVPSTAAPIQRLPISGQPLDPGPMVEGYPEVQRGSAPGLPEPTDRQKELIRAGRDLTVDFGKVGLAATSGAALITSIPVSLPAATTGLLSAMVGAALYSGSKPAEGIKGAIKNLADEEKLWILFTGAATGVGRALKPFWEAGKGIARAKWADYAFKQAAREVGLDKAAQSMVAGDTAKAAEIVNAAAEKISQGAGVPFETQKQLLWKTVTEAKNQIESGQKIDWVELNSQFMNTSEDAAKVAEQTIRAARDAKYKAIQTQDAFEREAPVAAPIPAPEPGPMPVTPVPTPGIEPPIVQPPITMTTQATEEQAYYKYLEDRYANMSEAERAAVDNYREIQPEMQRIDEEGSVGLGGEPTVKVQKEVEVPMGDALHSENPRIEKILSATKPKERETLFKYLTGPIKTVWDEIFVPFPAGSPPPEVANLLRLAYDWPKQIGTKGVDMMMGYLGPLKPPGLTAATFRNKLSKNEYLAFERLVDLRSMRADAKQGILTATVSPEAQKGYANIPKSAPAYKDLTESAARSALSDIESEIASIENVLKQVSRDYKKIPGAPVEKVSSFDIVNGSLERRDALWRAYGRDLVKRGLIRPEDLKEHYAANIILKHISLLDDFGIRLPQRLKRAWRGYTMKREGTTAPHETNVVVRDFDTISKIELHNRLDDLAAHIKTSYDATPYFTREEMIEKFGQRLIDLEKYSAIPENLRADWKIIKGSDGRMYAETYNNPKPNDHKVIEIRDKRWKAISMNPGRSYYNAQSITEKRVAEMWNQLLADEDAVLPTQEVLSYLKPIKAVGGPREVVILPEAVADAVLKMRASTFPSKLSRYLFKGTSAWKRVTLDLAGIPFQVNNFVGDMINLAREDPAAFTRIGGAIRSAYEANPFGPQILFKHNPERLSPELKTALTVAEQQSVIKSSALFSSDVYKATFDPRLYKYRGLAGAFGRWNPINWIEGFSEFRESVPRMTYIIKQMERATDPKFQAWRDARIKKGLPLLETKTVDTTGLDEIAGIGKAAREIFVDYGKITPLMARTGRVLFPFSTFYIQNAGNWAKYAAKHPLGAVAKIGVPYVLMNTWNWTYFPEQERNISKLWRYIPHVWTPYKAKDGRLICIALQTPVDMAFRLIPGLSSALDMLPRYFKTKDKDDIELLWRETWTAAGMPTETALALLNPAIKTSMDLIANKDYFGNKIYPDAEKGSWSAKQKMATYFLTGMVSPFMQYSRAEEVKSTFPVIEKRFSGTSQPPGWRRELVQNIPKAIQYGPLNVSRAAGIRPINTEGAELQRIKLSESLVDQEAYEKANKMHQQALDAIEVKFDTLSATEDQAVNEYSKAAMEQGLSLAADYRAVQADPDMSMMEKDRAARVVKLASEKYKNLAQGTDRISRIKIMGDIINRQIISETDPSRLAKLQAKLMKYENEGSDLFILSRKNKLSPKAQQDVENHFDRQEVTTPRSSLY